MKLLVTQLFLLFGLSCALDKDHIETWLNLDLTSLDTPAMRALINEKSREMNEFGHFHIPSFLTASTIQTFRDEMFGAESVLRDQAATVFQDEGDLKNFDESSPRNFMMPRSIAFVPRRHLKSSSVESLYNYECLLEFWRAIIVNRNISEVQYNSNDLYLSSDVDGSVYALIIGDGGVGDKGTWHFDEHPFSCVYMIQKPTAGGQMKHAYLPISDAYSWTTIAEKYWRNWPEVGHILKEEDAATPVHTVPAQEGDVYCFYGNEELHTIDPVEGDRQRGVYVMAYSDKEGFKHSDDVKKQNQWGERADEAAAQKANKEDL